MYLLPKIVVSPSGYGAPINLLVPGAAMTIVRLVALRRDVSPDDIIGPRRDRHLVAARYEAIRLVKDHCPHLSYPGIGRVFHRDHTSILNALGRVKKNKKSTAA
jgi:chromosomal replication initiation ATPase DnaA